MTFSQSAIYIYKEYKMKAGSVKHHIVFDMPYVHGYLQQGGKYWSLWSSSVVQRQTTEQFSFQDVLEHAHITWHYCMYYHGNTEISHPKVLCIYTGFENGHASHAYVHTVHVCIWCGWLCICNNYKASNNRFAHKLYKTYTASVGLSWVRRPTSSVRVQ